MYALYSLRICEQGCVCVCEHKSVFPTMTEWRVCAWLGKETGREARKGLSLCLLLFSSTVSAYNKAVQWKENIGRKREMWGGRKERYEREKKGLREGKRRYCLNKELQERYWSQFSKQRRLFGSHSQLGDWNWSMSCIKKNSWKKHPSLRPALSLRSGIFFLYPSWKSLP